MSHCEFDTLIHKPGLKPSMKLLEGTEGLLRIETFLYWKQLTCKTCLHRKCPTLERCQSVSEISRCNLILSSVCFSSCVNRYDFVKLNRDHFQKIVKPVSWNSYNDYKSKPLARYLSD